MTESDLKLPFYAWECITLMHKDRDIDLVIKDEAMLKVLMLFLIVKLNTINGVRDTFQELKRTKGIKRSDSIAKYTRHIYKSFMIMKVRMKISFEACYQRKTIQEMMLMAILKTYHERN